MNGLIHDVRYALRLLRKSPGFTLTAVLTLAFGIGATAAIFSIVEGVLLRPLPFPQPDRLAVLSDHLEGTDFNNGESGVTTPEIAAYQRGTSSFQNLGGYRQNAYELSGAGAPAQINAARMTASMFPVLGVAPIIGRTFTQQEDDGCVQVAVLSYAMWHSRFAADPQILGRKILLHLLIFLVRFLRFHLAHRIALLPPGLDLKLILPVLAGEGLIHAVFLVDCLVLHVFHIVIVRLQRIQIKISDPENRSRHRPHRRLTALRLLF